MKQILITGSNGYLGKNLVTYLEKKQIFNIKTLSRKKNNEFSARVKQLINYDFNKIFNYSKILENVETVVHLAAYSNESKKNFNKDDFEKINIIFLKKLLKECNKFKIKKFIFVSTSKVYGEHNINKEIFNIHSDTNPQNHYSQSKLIGEKIINNYCRLYKIEFLIIRMPMVYGEKNNKNFRLLESYVKYHLPVPLKNFKNSKSVLHIENFCDFIFKMLTIDKFLKNIINICDDEDLLTSDLINHFIKKYNSKNLKFYLPAKLIKFSFNLIGKKNLYIKLFLDNKLSNSSAKNIYNWRPKYSFKDYI